MTTQEVADKLVALCREGNYTEAYSLCAENAVSMEMQGMPNSRTEGREQIVKEYLEWEKGIEEMHGGSVGDPLVAGNHFVVPMSIDATFKDRGRQAFDELCLYQVQNGEIVQASYHYELPSM